MDTDELAELARRIQAGDSAAARALVGATRELVWRLVRAYRGRIEGADDVTQEVYTTLFARIHRFRPRGGVPFAHWLSRLTVNVCRDRWRAETRRRRWLEQPPALDDDERRWLQTATHSPSVPLDDAVAARDLVLKLLRQLPAEDRLLLSLLELEEYSAEEVSGMLGWTASRVRVRALRARRKLLAAVETLETNDASGAKR